MVRRVRKSVTLPMVFMDLCQCRVFLRYGTFLKTAADIGMDGLVLPDVPFEEKADFAPDCQKYGLDLISFIAPTSKNRITKIAGEAVCFVYCVSAS